MEWTNEQKNAIYLKDKNILVAAAAGSGKTAVLVERIINKIVNENVDIDKLLVVTFTNAAAAEMRERILKAIYEKQDNINNEEEEEKLQKQIMLLNKASICTIDSFCLEVIRNNFYELDISPNFRIADTSEMELLKQEVLEELFEEKYETQNEDFEELIKTYTSYRDDTPLKNLILKIHTYIEASPFPKMWLEEQVEKFNIKDLSVDFSNTSWGKILLKEIKEELIDDIATLKTQELKLSVDKDLEKFTQVLRSDIAQLELLDANLDSWDKSYTISQTIEFVKWPTNKILSEAKEVAKQVRDEVKKKLKGKFEKIFTSASEEANKDILDMYIVLSKLKNIILEFDEKLYKKKKEKNILDFSDIEHLALKLLVKNEDGKIEKTDIAKMYTNKFKEIAIDEYQDSNLVQEYILKSVSRGNNIFMVGDVKQSIYKFRQARPELFLEKYATYKLKGEEISSGMKIQLFKNFRSRNNVLDLTNLIFENIMSKNLGDICYDENEFLNLGANYPELENSIIENEEDTENTGKASYAGIAELDIIDLKADEIDIYKDESEENVDNSAENQNTSNENNNLDENTDEINDSQERIEDVVLEAKYVAKKIKELIDSNYMVYDRKRGYRKVTYKDVVVLLRSTKISAPIFEKEISSLNMPVFSDVSSEYLETMEIQTVMSLLKVIDNPMQDIPLVTVLRSSIGGFTDNELVEIRENEKNISFYESVKNKYDELKSKHKEQIKENTEIDERESIQDNKNDLFNKLENFLTNLKKWQSEEKYMSLDELIWQIYSDTNFYNYVTLLPNGNLRQANLKILFERAKQYETASFKGLFNFINFIDKLHSSSGDLSSAKLIGENENVIRIMSIHKSKGLEFPVVFLSCMGKQFNMQDLNDNIILHQDLGFGPKYINADKKIEYTTLAKEAIRLRAKVETLSEEMRVLYVALTRAKEKLIITGVCKDVQKAFKEKESLIQMYKSDNKEINHVLLKKYKSYLDWIELVYFNNIDVIDKYMNVNIIKKSDLLNDLIEKESIDAEDNLLVTLNNRAKEANKLAIDELSKQLKWKYFFMESSVIPTKTSVTKLKEAENEQIISIEEINEQGSDEQSEESKFAVARPQFLNEDTQITNAQKGTLMHLCFQKLDEHKEYTKQMIQELVDDMVRRKIITELEGKSINTYKLYSYTKSELFKQLKNAKRVYKEQPFYISLTADEIYGNGCKDNILVQGIIDLYFVNQDGSIVLVDYKTDYVEKGKENELVEKYRKQLEIYRKALEQALGKNVDKCYIYSVYLEKLIKM